MKRLALFAAVVLAVTACAKSDEKPVDTTSKMAPAPAMADSAKMADSVKMKAATDSTHKADSVKAAAALKTVPTKGKTKGGAKKP
jgi:hypothetical protein